MTGHRPGLHDLRESRGPGRGPSAAADDADGPVAIAGAEEGGDVGVGSLGSRRKTARRAPGESGAGLGRGSANGYFLGAGGM